MLHVLDVPVAVHLPPERLQRCYYEVSGDGLQQVQH